VRQLKNVIESLVVMDIDEVLDLDDLSPDLYDGPVSGGSAGSDSASATTSAGASANDPLQAGSADPMTSTLVGKSLKEIEKWAIEHTLTLGNHNREETARILGISERNLYRKLREYELR